MRTSLLASFAAVTMVAILGGLTGWYVYLHTHTQAIRAADTARGFSVGSFPGILGIGGSSGNPGVTSLGNVASNASTSTATSSEEAAVVAPTPQTPRLWHAAKAPVAGFGFVQGDHGYVLRYAERATGYVFSADPWSGAVERIVNTLRPKTEEAYFASSTVIMRSFQNGYLDTWSGTVGRSATTTALVGNSLGSAISALSLDGYTGTLFTLRAVAGGTEGVLAQPDGSKPRTLFSSTLRSWKPIVTPGHIVVEQLSSDDVQGYAYEINKDGSLSKIVGGLPGLMVLPRPSSSALLYSTSRAGSPALFARATATSTPAQLSLKTIAEKCVWAPGAASASLFAYCAVPHPFSNRSFLDEWHQGVFFTEDTWWQIDAVAGATQALYASQDHPDVRDPQIDPSGKFIAFIDGRDSSLWVLRVVQ